MSSEEKLNKVLLITVNEKKIIFLKTKLAYYYNNM